MPKSIRGLCKLVIINDAIDNSKIVQRNLLGVFKFFTLLEKKFCVFHPYGTIWFFSLLSETIFRRFTHCLIGSFLAVNENDCDTCRNQHINHKRYDLCEISNYKKNSLIFAAIEFGLPYRAEAVVRMAINWTIFAF